MLSIVGKLPQTWVGDHWCEKFGMPADDAAGIGHTLEQVAAFSATKELLIGYATAVRKKTLSVLQSLTPADLEREVTSVMGKTMMAERYLKSLIFDYLHHTGQIAYLRGYLKGRWDPPYTLWSTVRL